MTCCAVTGGVNQPPLRLHGSAAEVSPNVEADAGKRTQLETRTLGGAEPRESRQPSSQTPSSSSLSDPVTQSARSSWSAGLWGSCPAAACGRKTGQTSVEQPKRLKGFIPLKIQRLLKFYLNERERRVILVDLRQNQL